MAYFFTDKEIEEVERERVEKKIEDLNESLNQANKEINNLNDNISQLERDKNKEIDEKNNLEGQLNNLNGKINNMINATIGDDTPWIPSIKFTPAQGQLGQKQLLYYDYSGFGMFRINIRAFNDKIFIKNNDEYIANFNFGGWAYLPPFPFNGKGILTFEIEWGPEDKGQFIDISYINV